MTSVPHVAEPARVGDRRPQMLLILSENWSMSTGTAIAPMIEWARIAEDTGFDAVMVGEHVVLGPDAGANGIMGNPRAYAMPGNQDPLTPWPSSLLLLSAIAAVTARVRLVASGLLTPLRHPLLLAREIGTLDLISGGRLVVQPTVSWSLDEYRALGVPFARRGRILDEQLQVLELLWRASPVSFHGEFYDFDDVYFEPKAYRADGPRLWFGGQNLHPPMLRRLVRHGHGFHPLGMPTEAETQLLRAALADAGREPHALEWVGGVRAVFPNDRSTADLAQAMSVIPEQWQRGFSTFCVKPAQFIDDATQMEPFCREVIRRLGELVCVSR